MRMPTNRHPDPPKQRYRRCSRRGRGRRAGRRRRAAQPADPAPRPRRAARRRPRPRPPSCKDAWLRAKAETENIRKQAAGRRRQGAQVRASRASPSDLLPVKDAWRRRSRPSNASPEALRAGVELTLKQLAAAFDKAQIVEIDPAGEKFDPHRHQAMAMVDADAAGQHGRAGVAEGLPAHDRVLRPALVTVAKPKATTARTPRRRASA